MENEDPLYEDYGSIEIPKSVGRLRHKRILGAPPAFWADVCRLTRGRSALVVAMCVYRRTIATKSKTVTLTGAELAELRLRRAVVAKALAKLEAGGIVTLDRRGAGRRLGVTLVWKGASPR